MKLHERSHSFRDLRLRGVYCPPKPSLRVTNTALTSGRGRTSCCPMHLHPSSLCPHPASAGVIFPFLFLHSFESLDNRVNRVLPVVQTNRPALIWRPVHLPHLLCKSPVLHRSSVACMYACSQEGPYLGRVVQDSLQVRPMCKKSRRIFTGGGVHARRQRRIFPLGGPVRTRICRISLHLSLIANVQDSFSFLTASIFQLALRLLTASVHLTFKL